MSIQDTVHFDNTGEVVRHPLVKRFFLALVIVLVAVLGFGVGKLSGQGSRAGVEINYDPSALNDPLPAAPVTTAVKTSQTSSVVQAKNQARTPSGAVFASANGKRYYYPGCSNTISEKNKVSFATAAMAEQAGYTLSANCKAPQ
jgi:hypothetical protein